MKNMLNITLRDFAGPFIQFITNLLGDDGETWWNAFKRFLRKENPWEVVKSVLADMISAGNFDWVNSNITEKNFPPESLILGTEPKLYHFHRNISSEETIALMDADGYRPGTLGDLLDYGMKNPKEQRKYPIIALGSVAVFVDGRFVAFLGRGGSGRELNLDRFDLDWLGSCRFLAVRK